MNYQEATFILDEYVDHYFVNIVFNDDNNDSPINEIIITVVNKNNTFICRGPTFDIVVQQIEEKLGIPIIKSNELND